MLGSHALKSWFGTQPVIDMSSEKAAFLCGRPFGVFAGCCLDQKGQLGDLEMPWNVQHRFHEVQPCAVELRKSRSKETTIQPTPCASLANTLGLCLVSCT